MAFSSWCACQVFDVQQKLNAQRTVFLRRQFARDARASRQAYLRQCLYGVSAQIARELAGEVEL